ncbi:MAG: magnesium-translocating P-type ATPase, partial [Clostridiales bacterium]|nr:magnesium-translocating P-type ATPase [Clostridiales bacterium]
KTSFDEGVNSVSWLLIKFMMIMVPIVFIINGITKKDWLQAFLFAVSIAVGLTPEMLPMIVTSNLAKGSVAMAKKKTVVKHLSAIQNFGAMDILCTDKTGTLTIDRIVLEKYLDVHGNENERVLRHAYMNSYYQTGLKNLMDVAVIEYAEERGLRELQDIYTKIDEIPFDFERRRMSVILVDKNDKRQLVTKGAVEEMLSICSHAEYEGEVIPLTDDIRDKIIKTSENLNKDGMRVLAVAQKNFIPYDREFDVEDEVDMVLMGYIGFLDPPKESTKGAIEALNEYGVEVKILTGDNDHVTRKICSDVGLPVDRIILGHEVEEMTDEVLAEEAKNTTVFAKISPLQKARIIRVLQGKGHTVGYLGDGINDAAALRESDIGISVDNAVDIAKESSDIILLEKDLMVLEEGVIEGRKIFGNIIKYIKMTVSSNFGNVFSVLVASAFIPFLPMLPIHLLIQNLLYDISQIAIPWDTMDKEFLEIPRPWDASSIGKFSIFIGPISSIFDIVTFLVMWYVFKANIPEAQGIFHSGWFMVGLLTQTLVVHMLRTEKIPFIQSRATWPVMIMTVIIMALGVYIPFSPLGLSVGFEPLPMAYFPWMIGIVLSYCIITQFTKMWYIK